MLLLLPLVAFDIRNGSPQSLFNLVSFIYLPLLSRDQSSSGSSFETFSHSKNLLGVMRAPSKTMTLMLRRKAVTSIAKYSSQSTPCQASFAANHVSSSTISSSYSEIISRPPRPMPKSPPLSILPLSSILRSIATNSVSSSRVSLIEYVPIRMLSYAVLIVFRFSSALLSPSWPSSHVLNRRYYPPTQTHFFEAS
jgi:hypothetical protein